MKMLIPAAVLMAALSMTACNGNRDGDAGDGVSGASGQPEATPATPPADAPADATADASLASASDPAATGMGAAAGATATGNDADLLGVLAAIDQHEIDSATQAKQHKLSADVANYADLMLTDHRANLDQTRALGANEQAPKAMTQAEQGKQHLAELGKKPDAEYAKAFVDAMVMGHTQALAALDEQLIPAAQAEPVKTHLQQTRAKVAEHLEKAKALQAKG
ncbi:DUF4142 domain-containing protein [Pseudoxanthomonas indica]|uniref:Predicted outer membrane protein n=1 Tax=Pseudoxanthomonas indica TaxID=428993 RepID=A0A1T5ISX4_9GAMM|nr:DUF4142 domain-containing protein [Pseudoxanthomonas indica]GGD54098.1 hypothetical protein GCM10007235_27980 [Pseudoxanthomonas indica]SKC42287.1 Predicted outer membrane protein [Pseudoxanthomonas indica]